MDFPLAALGYVVTIDDNGLSKLTLNGVVIGTGPAILVDGSWFYRPFDQAGFAPTLATKSVMTIQNGAEVTHTYTGVVTARVVYTYIVSGNDIHVSAMVFNTGTKPLQPGMRSLRLLPWTGGYSIGLGYDQSHTQNQGPKLSYPSSNVPLAASVVSGSVGTSPLNAATFSEEEPNEKFMTVLTGLYQNPGYSFTSIFFNNVPPGGSRVYKWGFRFLAHTSDWKELLGGYKAALRAAFPAIAYEPNAKPLVQFAAINTSYIRPDNPYGYNDNGNGITRRFDKLEGCQDYVSKLVGPMVDTGYQGIVMWQPQGIHTRGVQYRPDFNSFPVVTLPNLPTLTAGFNVAGLKVGLLARPGIAITSAGDWNHDSSIRVCECQGTFDDLNWRIDWTKAQGFKGFYLDSFIADGGDQGILRAIRARVGMEHTFVEHSTAISMAYGAAYEEVSWSGGTVSLSLMQQILRWLWPESIVAAKFRGALPAGGYAELYAAMFALKLTPWVEDYRVWSGTENAILKPLVASKIGPNGRWL